MNMNRSKPCGETVSRLRSVGCAALLFFLLFTQPSYGESRTVAFTHTMNWSSMELLLELKADLPSEGTNLSKARSTAEQAIAEELPLCIRDALFPLFIDSFRTVKEATKGDAGLLSKLYGIAASGEKSFSRFTTDMKSLTVSYRLPLYPYIVTPFITHSFPYNPPRLLSWEPANKFSGIVIYVKGEYPIYGEGKQGKLNPCFFPAIYNEDMQLILESKMMLPKTLAHWGVAAYSDTTDEKPFAERIGNAPYRILAVGIYGKNRTDIIVPREAGNKLLYSEYTRTLLAEGKILIIYDK